jgi:glycosyltransferase involved in cell wall biosynthesis
MKTITLLVPCYNEEAVLPLFISAAERLMERKDYDWRLLLVDDGSMDGTLVQMSKAHERDSRISYLELSRNFGKEAAMLAGLDYVDTDCVVLMDADLQHPLEVVPEMLEKWEKGYEDVYASRLTRGRESWMRRRFTGLYYKLLQSASENEVYPNVGDFRLLDRVCVEALRQLRESNRYTKGLYGYIGFKKSFVQFETADRAAGESKMSARKLWKLAIDGLLSSSIKPLRIATYTGLLVSLSAFVYMLFVFVKTLIYGDPVRGYPTLVVLVLFLGGIQLFALGVVGEYVGRIFTETKKRPNYFIRTMNGEKRVSK